MLFWYSAIVTSPIHKVVGVSVRTKLLPGGGMEGFLAKISLNFLCAA